MKKRDTHGITIMTDDTELKAELARVFGLTKGDTDDVLRKLASLAEIFHTNANDLFVHWETFNVTKVQDDLELTVINLDKFHEYLQEILANKGTPSMRGSKEVLGGTVKKPLLRPSIAISSSSPSSGFPATPSLKRRKVPEGSAFKTPRTGLESSPVDYVSANNTFHSPSSNTNYSDDIQSSPTKTRQNEGLPIEVLNPNLPELTFEGETSDDTSKPFSISLNFDPSKYKFRTMSMKLLESADVLDDQIDTMASIILENKKDIELSNPCLSSQFDIYCCGRIVPDSPLYDKSSNQTLNASALYLETSRLSGVGQRVPLNLSELEEYSLFPGQIVFLKGRNPTGQEFSVKEILPLPELGMPLSNQDDLEHFAEINGHQGLKVILAAGPFCNNNTIDFTKFSQFVDKINTLNPHIVILVGPFIDITNNLVRSGDIDLQNEKKQIKDLDDLFRATISPIIRKINSKILVIMIPSLRDAVIKHCSYPQDKFDRKKFGLPKNAKVFPNPSSFSANEILFGCSNLDVFKDLRDVHKLSKTTEKPKILSNRFDRIINHIFEQRRYYPMFPSSASFGANKNNEGEANEASQNGNMGDLLSRSDVNCASLEVPYLGLSELGDCLPDVFISPSELKPFVRVVKGVLVVNPGQFIKPSKDAAKESGSYAVFDIQSPDVSFSAENNVERADTHEHEYYHNVHKRSRVSINRV